MPDDYVRASIEGLAKAERAMRNLDLKARRRVASAGVRAGAKVIVRKARSEAPRRRGFLARQIHSRLKYDRASGTVSAIIKPRRTKAQARKGQRVRGNVLHLVVGGTSPHLIRTRRKSALTVGGSLYEEVMHPGARANPFMDRAAQSSFTESTKAFQKAFGQKLEAEARKENTR